MASPIPMEAPVTTTTFPASSMPAFVFSPHIEVKPSPPPGTSRTIEQPQTHRRRSAVTNLIPLFPLDVVLFPGAPLPLHIFEPRCKEMIGECLADKSTFGVLRAGEKSIAEIGCTAEII